MLNKDFEINPYCMGLSNKVNLLHSPGNKYFMRKHDLSFNNIHCTLLLGV